MCVVAYWLKTTWMVWQKFQKFYLDIRGEFRQKIKTCPTGGAEQNVLKMFFVDVPCYINQETTNNIIKCAKLLIFAGDTAEVHLNRLAHEVNIILKPVKYTKRCTPTIDLSSKRRRRTLKIHRVPSFIVVNFFPVEAE